MKLEALKLVVALLLNWRKAMQHHLPGVLESAWGLLRGCLPLYVSGIVRGDEEVDDGEVSPAHCFANEPIGIGHIIKRRVIPCRRGQRHACQQAYISLLMRTGDKCDF